MEKKFDFKKTIWQSETFEKKIMADDVEITARAFWFSEKHYDNRILVVNFGVNGDALHACIMTENEFDNLTDCNYFNTMRRIFTKVNLMPFTPDQEPVPYTDEENKKRAQEFLSNQNFDKLRSVGDYKNQDGHCGTWREEAPIGILQMKDGEEPKYISLEQLAQEKITQLTDADKEKVREIREAEQEKEHKNISAIIFCIVVFIIVLLLTSLPSKAHAQESYLYKLYKDCDIKKTQAARDSLIVLIESDKKFTRFNNMMGWGDSALLLDLHIMDIDINLAIIFNDDLIYCLESKKKFKEAEDPRNITALLNVLKMVNEGLINLLEERLQRKKRLDDTKL